MQALSCIPLWDASALLYPFKGVCFLTQGILMTIKAMKKVQAYFLDTQTVAPKAAQAVFNALDKAMASVERKGK
jgi:hypothetical protein